MTGYSRDELIQKDNRIVFENDGEYENLSKSEGPRNNEKSGTITVETQLRKKDGNVLAVILKLTPLEPENLSEGMMYTALDITERIIFRRDPAFGKPET